MKKLLIATPTDDYANTLRSALKETWEVHICTDGYTVIDTLGYLQPDAMILELNLPRKDGFAVLEECFPNTPPVVLALSPICSDYIINTAHSLGIDYLISLPCQVEEIIHRLDDMCIALEQEPSAVERHLEALGIKKTTDGCRFLLTAIPIVAENPSIRLHKELYSTIVQQCHAGNEVCVERSIRFAIQSAWKKRRFSVWRQYFPADKDGNVECPSIKEFLIALAKKL